MEVRVFCYYYLKSQTKLSRNSDVKKIYRSYRNKHDQNKNISLHYAKLIDQSLHRTCFQNIKEVSGIKHDKEKPETPL